MHVIRCAQNEQVSKWSLWYLYGIMLKVYMTAPSRLNDIEYLSHGLQHGIMGGTRYADRRSVPTKHIQ